eukprot:3941596-Rhodomonas_salina.2
MSGISITYRDCDSSMEQQRAVLRKRIEQRMGQPCAVLSLVPYGAAACGTTEQRCAVLRSRPLQTQIQETAFSAQFVPGCGRKRCGAGEWPRVRFVFSLMCAPYHHLPADLPTRTYLITYAAYT